MEYVKNINTGETLLYHGSKNGIAKPIKPYCNNGNTDFGDAFYLGTKKVQAISRVSNEASAVLYEFRIPLTYLNESNTLELNARDWMYFVLYNRKYLEDMSDTKFYQYYAHLADGKDFIVGAIADDVYDKCVKDFRDNNITDYTFMQLIDCFDYGVQIAAKSQRACNILEEYSRHPLTKEERKENISQRKMTNKERWAYYDKMKAKFNTERKGKYLSEIKEEIREKEQQEKPQMEDKTPIISDGFSNIQFPNKIHKRKDVEHELF